MKGEKKFELKKGDIDNLNKEDLGEITSSLVTFGNSKGFSLFVEHLRNKYVTDSMYENRGVITENYFLGGLDMLDSIESFILETSGFEKNIINTKKK